MKRRKLGSRGPEISRVGFGAWEAGGLWGKNPEDAEIVRAMHAAFDAGMNWIDTAEIYGNGRSEEIVGQAVAGRRDVLVFTKVAGNPPGTGYQPAQIRAAAEASLRRLKRDVIDLYQIHFPSPDLKVDEAWGAMGKLADDGLVRHVGVSNFDRALIERCEVIRHVDSLQPQFSLVWQNGRSDLFPFCKKNGTGVIAYGPLGYGLLTGAITMATTFDDDDWRAGKFSFGPLKALADTFFAPEARKRHLAVVQAIEPVAKRLGVTRGQLAIAWVAHQEGLTGAIVGTRSANRATENARAGTLDLSDRDLAEIDRCVASVN